jgi:excisionase family DNA binding protein
MIENAATFDSERRLLTVDELAGRLGLMRDTLYHWRMRGEGPQAIKVGGRVRYRQSDVEAWLKSREDQ